MVSGKRIKYFSWRENKRVGGGGGGGGAGSILVGGHDGA